MTPRRRQKGTGSVYQRASDGRWLGTIDAGYTRTGTRRRVTVTGKTEAEVKRKLRDKRLVIERDGLSEGSRLTVKAWSDEWTARQAYRLRPKTLQAYEASMRHIVAAIGHRRLADLTPGDVRAVEMAQRDAGLVSTTALHTHAVLAKMLRDALIDGHPIRPQVLAMKRPAKAVHDRTNLTVPEALAVLRAAHDLPHRSRWYAALLQGMRRGECLGLTWDAVDLDSGILAVSWQLQALPYKTPRDRSSGFRIPDGYEARPLHGALHLVRPKTERGWRIIPLVEPMRLMLADWQGRQDSPHGLVWPAANGQPADVKDDLEEWKALQCTAGVGHPSGRHYVLHEARNTTATLLMETRTPAEVITAIMGHSSIVTSRAYMHVSTDQARLALEQVARRLQIEA